jgi:PD-(D/E)XK nuclease superfamily protein
MSASTLTIDRMQLTEPQRRTWERLIDAGERPTFAADLTQRLRDRVEEAARGLEMAQPLWIGKEKLNDLGRCEGSFEAKIMGEGPPFEHKPATASGVLHHKAIEVEVGGRDELDPHDVALTAADRLCEREERFAQYWRQLARPDQDEALMEVVRRVTLFRSSFPPLREMRRELGPVSELTARAELLGGALVLSGKIDLVLGLPVRAAPDRATRLVIDLKTGTARPQYPEDLRFYALIMSLRFGVPPYRVASFFLESGEWQAEDVGEQALQHAADRVIAAARAAAALANGREPTLTPGVYCGWCPRAEVCPAALIASA